MPGIGGRRNLHKSETGSKRKLVGQLARAKRKGANFSSETQRVLEQGTEYRKLAANLRRLERQGKKLSSRGERTLRELEEGGY